MATSLKLRRGTTAQHASFTGSIAEVTVDTDKDTVVVHDGSTAGGFPLARASGSAISATSLSDSGNLTFTGTGNRITGDFSNATHANRVAFQTSTTDGATSPFILPNGTGTLASIVVANASDPTNSGYGQLRVTSSSADILSGILGTGSYLPLTMYTGGSERLRIDTSGNVGIGTSSPSQKLEVSGSVRLDGRGNGFAYRTPDWRIYNTSSGNALAFDDYVTERMRIDSSGNVGIGTSSPARRLDVRGALGMQVNEDGAGTKVISMRSDFAGAGPAINVTTNDPLLFLTNNTERMRIDSSGNLLVGTTANPWSTKIIGVSNGSGSFSFQPANTTTNFRVWGANTSSVYFDNSGSLNYTFSSGSGSSFAPITASAFNIGSDYRLKENITPLTAALSQVNKFKPVKFSYKENNKISMPWGTEIVDGFLAHEFAEVVPTAVTGKKDAVDEKGEMVIQTLDMTKAIPLLVAAIQEQQAIITDLKARIETLESK